jgi:hypothetical protein
VQEVIGMRKWAVIVILFSLVLAGNSSGSSTTPTLENLDELFLTDTYLITGEQAHYIDILGCTEIGYAITRAGTGHINDIHMIFDTQHHETGNIISLGGPAVNPVTEEFNRLFGIVYSESHSLFEIQAEGLSISMNGNDCQHEGICIIYLSRDNDRNVMLVWGYGWRCTYAGAQFLSETRNWQIHAGTHLLLLRWRDSNMDGLVQTHEIHVEDSR